MNNQIISILITATIVFLFQEWRHRVKQPVFYNANPPRVQEWQDFVIANINSCVHPEQAMQCIELVNLFQTRFKNQLPGNRVNEITADMWNRLDTKYKILKHDFESSELTIEQLIN